MLNIVTQFEVFCLSKVKLFFYIEWLQIEWNISKILFSCNFDHDGLRIREKKKKNSVSPKIWTSIKPIKKGCFLEKGCSFLWTQYLNRPPFAAKLVWVSGESGPCSTARCLWTPLNVAAHFERFSLSVHSAEGEHFLQFPARKVARLRMQRKMFLCLFFLSPTLD